MHFQDILKAIRLIEQFAGEMDFAEYADDVKTRAAVERELQIVTEAAYRLKEEDEVLCPGPDWRRITIKDDLPALKRDVEKALATHFPATGGF